MAVRIVGEYINLFTLSMNHEKNPACRVRQTDFYDKEKQNQYKKTVLVPIYSSKYNFKNSTVCIAINFKTFYPNYTLQICTHRDQKI